MPREEKRIVGSADERSANHVPENCGVISGETQLAEQPTPGAVNAR